MGNSLLFLLSLFYLSVLGFFCLIKLSPVSFLFKFRLNVGATVIFAVLGENIGMFQNFP